MTATTECPSGVAHGDHVVDVGVVVVTFNSSDVIESLLESLPSALDGVPSSRVTIVDNGSGDDTVAIVRRAAPWASVVELGANLGFAAGINAGLRRSLPRAAVMVLNPDTRPGPGSIKRLLQTVESDARIGLAVPRLVGTDGELSHSLRREPTILRALGEAVVGGRRASRIPLLGETIGSESHYVDGADAAWATGAAVLIARRVVDAVGPWTEDFFLYSEETDYALRARDAGFQLRYVAAAEVVHRGGDLNRSPWLWSLRAVNRVRLYRRRHGAFKSAFYWLAAILNEGLRAASGSATHRAALRALLVGHEQVKADDRPSGKRR